MANFLQVAEVLDWDSPKLIECDKHPHDSVAVCLKFNWRSWRRMAQVSPYGQHKQERRRKGRSNRAARAADAEDRWAQYSSRRGAARVVVFDEEVEVVDEEEEVVRVEGSCSTEPSPAPSAEDPCEADMSERPWASAGAGPSAAS